MEHRDAQILHAAFTVFSKYGVAKTTMNDIAAEAGVARQTVYNAFPGKPELLRACMRKGVAEAQAEVRAGWAEAVSLDAKIDCFFDHAPLYWYKIVHQSPQLAELMDGINAHASKELTEAAKSWKAMFVEMLESVGVTPKDPAISHADLAEFLFSASMNAKYDADDIGVLRNRLRVIKAALIGLVT